MMPDIPSKMAGRSVPDIDWLLRPWSNSINPVHHLLRIFARRSKSSGRKVLLDVCVAYIRKKGSSELRTTLALKATDLDANLAYSPSKLRNTLHSSSFFLIGTAIPVLGTRSEESNLGMGAARSFPWGVCGRNVGSLSVEKDFGSTGTLGMAGTAGISASVKANDSLPFWNNWLIGRVFLLSRVDRRETVRSLPCFSVDEEGSPLPTIFSFVDLLCLYDSLLFVDDLFPDNAPPSKEMGAPASLLSCGLVPFSFLGDGDREGVDGCDAPYHDRLFNRREKELFTDGRDLAAAEPGVVAGVEVVVVRDESKLVFAVLPRRTNEWTLLSSSSVSVAPTRPCTLILGLFCNSAISAAASVTGALCSTNSSGVVHPEESGGDVSCSSPGPPRSASEKLPLIVVTSAVLSFAPGK